MMNSKVYRCLEVTYKCCAILYEGLEHQILVWEWGDPGISFLVTICMHNYTLKEGCLPPRIS